MEQAYPTQDSAYMQKYYQNEEDREPGLSLVEKAAIGVLTGVAGYAVARRTGLGNRLAKHIERDLAGAKQGIKEAIDKNRIPKLMTGKNMDVLRIAKQMKKDFSEGQERFKREYDAKIKNSEHREMDMERYLKQFNEMVGKKGTTDGQLFHIMDDNMRYSALATHIRQSKNTAIQENADDLIKAIRSMNPGSIKSYNKEKFKLHLNKNGIENKEQIDALEELRKSVNQQKFLKKDDKESIALLDKNREAFRQVFTEETPKLIKQDNSFKKLLSGSRQATVEDILRLHKQGTFKISKEMYESLNESIKIDNKFKEAVFDKNLVIRTGFGKKEHIEDYNAYQGLRRDAGEWFAGTMPGGILHMRDAMNAIDGRELFNSHFLRRGTQQSSLQAQMGQETTDFLEQHLLKIGGKVVRTIDSKMLFEDAPIEILNKKRDIFLTSSMNGSATRMVRHVADTMTPDNPDRNKVFDLLDIGNQDKDNNFHKIGSIIGKFMDEDWDRNWIVGKMNNGIDGVEDFYRMNAFFNWNSKPLSNRTMHALNGQFGEDLQKVINEQKTNFSNDDDILNLFETLGKRATEDKTGEGIGGVYRKYAMNKEQFLKQKTPYGESSFIIGDTVKSRTGLDQIKSALSEHMISNLNKKNYLDMPKYDPIDAGDMTRKLFDDMYDAGTITRQDFKAGQEAINYSLIRYAGRNIDSATSNAVYNVNNLMKDERFYNNALQMVKRTNPVWESKVKTMPENTTSDAMIVVNKADIFKNVMGAFDDTKSLKERMMSAIDPFVQLSGGRNRMEDFTTLSMIPYYAGYRLQDMLGTIGLGFSDKSMGSAAAIGANLFLKRLLPAYMGVEAYKYADYKLDESTGLGIDERYQNMIANHRLSAAYDMDDDERADELHRKQLKPGLDHFESMPSINIPIFGEVGPGAVLNGVSNLFYAKTDLNADSAMTVDEVRDDLENGEEEQRKSRWWLVGSKSAFRGDRISEFAPNAFRQAHSDWEWSGTGLTGDEYFSSRLYPTLENPLGALGQLIGTSNPYTFEEKHQEDRPYMLTGELFNPNTMFFGDVLNQTLGRVIKPVKEMHQEYWQDPELVQEFSDRETDNNRRLEDTPVTTTIGTGGRIKNVMYSDPNDYGGYDHVELSGQAPQSQVSYSELGNQYVVRKQQDGLGELTGGRTVYDMNTDKTIYVPASIPSDNTSYSNLFRMAADGDETDGISFKDGPEYTETYQAQVSTAPRSMLDQEYAYKDELRNRKLNNLIDPREQGWKNQEMIENWTEPLGVYKWLFSDEVLGYSPYEDKMVMQKADNAYNLSNSFSDANIGSLGASFSEFGRRFVRSDSGQLEQYNPIKNTMPDWMPGSNYFINFQQGDPYAKVDFGERRLPGAGYESLNELHPDEFGTYGAFDRFKILGDVAPWSDEYKYWSNFLLDNLVDEDMRKEATGIRRQVSQRKEKFEFTPYHFKHNDIQWMDVTVDKFLDGTTFLSKELGNQAIRLGGVDHHSNPDGLLNAYLDEGQKIKIGIAADENKQISKDTYKTMNAVVIDGVTNINQDIIRKGYMKENQNDFSATGIYSRFTPKEISQGKRWETLAHADNPFNTKLLQVRTATEEYERDQIYSKDWATWDNLAIKDYLIPTVEGLGHHGGYIQSGLAGGGLGFIVGYLGLHGGKERKAAMVGGALLGITSHALFNLYEDHTGKQWKPKRRRVEEDVNEYFDFLQYSKYSGLYENAREVIQHTMGVDVEEIIQQVNEKKFNNKELKKALQDERQKLYLEQPKGWEERKKKINKELADLQENGKIELELPEPILYAMNYREKRDTTLYAIDPTQDLMQVQKAMPYKDKWFFMDFVNASPEEREKLMKILPENQKRIYDAIWNHQNTPPPDESYYLQKYGGVPDETWNGWNPNIDLKDIKAQAVQQAGLDLTDFGIWEDDLANGPYVPALEADGGNNIYDDKSFKGYSSMEDNLYGVLNGIGVYDTNINVVPNDTGEVNVKINIEEDRSGEIGSTINRDKETYL